METIKVNMSPNPLDVQTIHASQNDGEARQWGFELHNNGELIDTSEVTEQLFFKSYKGGTEQLLPENGSVPTTSPIIADIKYPQGLLTDQEFLYRQSPTESDGLAKIQTIYGNTLKWNQLMRNGNFADGTSYYNASASTLTASNGVLTITKNQNTGAGIGYASPTNFNYVVGHKYLARVDYKGIAGKTLTVFSNSFSSGMTEIIPTDENWHTVSNIFNVTSLPTVSGILWLSYDTTTDDNVAQFRNYAIFDLTDIGIDSLTDAEIYQWFADYYPLPYYQYDSGSLLSFNGTGIKTVGKNQIANIVRGYFNAGAPTIRIDNDSESLVFYAIKGRTYTASSSIVLNRNNIARCDSPNLEDYTPIYDIVVGANKPRVWVATWTGWTVWYVYSTRNEAVENSAQVEFGSTATEYEPYTSSTLSLPISTYFPNGMNGVNDVHDELRENNAITRFAKVTYNGTESGWALLDSYGVFYIAPSNMAFSTNNAVCDSFRWVNNKSVSGMLDGDFTTKAGAGLSLWFKKDSITTVADWKTYLSNNPVTVVYEMATPTETSFTTASLVTENAEIPLSNEDGTLIGKCTEELSSQPGFIDAKIRLSDGDGDCYSNKIQLHVERKP